MFYIAEVQGCEPHVNFLLNEDTGGVLFFMTDIEAETYALENCAWNYRIVKF